MANTGTTAEVRNVAESLRVVLDAGAKRILSSMSGIADIPSGPANSLLGSGPAFIRTNGCGAQGTWPIFWFRAFVSEAISLKGGVDASLESTISDG